MWFVIAITKNPKFGIGTCQVHPIEAENEKLVLCRAKRWMKKNFRLRSKNYRFILTKEIREMELKE